MELENQLTEERELMAAADNDNDNDNDNDDFNRSLWELRELRSQLHHAASHCEATFLKAAQKKLVMKNTKNYICEAIVTVVDHLGTVSSNLDHRLNGVMEIPRTEQRIDCLQQRLLTCQQYALSLDLSTMRWSAKFPRHHRHYVSPLAQQLEKSNGNLRSDALDSKASETPCGKDQLPVAVDLSMFDAAVPVFEGASSTLSRPHNHSFGSQLKDAYHMLRSKDQRQKKLVQGSTFLSFLRTSKRRT